MRTHRWTFLVSGLLSASLLGCSVSDPTSGSMTPSSGGKADDGSGSGAWFPFDASCDGAPLSVDDARAFVQNHDPRNQTAGLFSIRPYARERTCFDGGGPCTAWEEWEPPQYTGLVTVSDVVDPDGTPDAQASLELVNIAPGPVSAPAMECWATTACTGLGTPDVTCGPVVTSDVRGGWCQNQVHDMLVLQGSLTASCAHLSAVETAWTNAQWDPVAQELRPAHIERETLFVRME